MKQLLTLIAVTCGITLAYAQQKMPKWTSAPTSKGKTVAMAENREEAKKKAIGQLYDSFGMQTDESSLRNRLCATDSTLVRYQRNAWVSAAMNTSYFKVTDTLKTETDFWVNCQISEKDLKLFVPELYSQSLQHGSESLTRARFMRENGDILSAAQQYAKGLNEVMPSIHRSMVSDMSGGKDVAIELFDEYLTVLDGIKVEAARTNCPMVKGEEVPLDLSFHITTADGKDIPNLPVKAWIEDKDAKVRCSSMTDRGGIATVRLTKAPMTEESKVWLSIDENSLFLLIPDNVAYNMLKQKVSGQFKSASIDLKAFDPTPTFSIKLDSLDIEQEPTLTSLMKKNGFVAADGLGDLELIMEFQDQMLGMPEKHGDFTLATHRCQLLITVMVRDSKLSLIQYQIKDFDLLQPANKSAVKVRARAIGEMMKQVRIELPEKLAEISYDKRKVMFK